MLIEKNNLYNLISWYSEMGIDDVTANDLKEEIKPRKATKRKVIAEVKAGNDKDNPVNSIQKNINFSLESPFKATAEARVLADQVQTLEDLRAAVDNFEGCQLKKTATNTVFGEGVTNASILFIGEAPGATEDAEGKPFCGDSGKLLDKMLATIGLSRKENFYITNTVFWRPPGNRQPTQQEIEICRPFVEKHIALINPKLIVLVGSTAATSLIGPHVQITKIRKEYYQYKNPYLSNDIPVTAVFHPAYLLRQPLQKKTMWYDLLHLQDYIRENKLLVL
ncbi:MAG: Uracil-DNA glycosylase [Rickettsiaceae bacterium]|jgi:DNA polymerase|nr:Uracil-DNA glycosylase [Rickettsiaceae bacterium]